MKTITIQQNQSILDILLQATGMLNGAIDLLRENGIDITNPCTPGTNINVPDGIEEDEAIVAYYERKGVKPATYVDLEGDEFYYDFGIEGIGEDLLNQIIDLVPPEQPIIISGNSNSLNVINLVDNVTEPQNLTFTLVLTHSNIQPFFKYYNNSQDDTRLNLFPSGLLEINDIDFGDYTSAQLLVRDEAGNSNSSALFFKDVTIVPLNYNDTSIFVRWDMNFGFIKVAKIRFIGDGTLIHETIYNTFITFNSGNQSPIASNIPILHLQELKIEAIDINGLVISETTILI